MSGFQTVQGHCILPAVDVNLEVLVSSGKNSVGPIVWLLQGLAHCVVTDEDMSARGEILTHMYVSLRLCAYRSGSDVPHGIPEACDECRWIGWRVSCTLLKEFTW